MAEVTEASLITLCNQHYLHTGRVATTLAVSPATALALMAQAATLGKYDYVGRLVLLMPHCLIPIVELPVPEPTVIADEALYARG